MRFAGVDVASETHVLAIVDEHGAVLVPATPVTEDASGYERLLVVLGDPLDVLVGLEATGHYWQNLFAVLASKGFRLCLINPLRTRRFAEEDLARAKTDAIDAVTIGRFLQQKRPDATPVPDAVTQELKELVALRDRVVQDLGDRVRQLHRLVDLGFPEFTRHVKHLATPLATGILRQYPTAASLKTLQPRRLARLAYDGKRKVGPELAQALCAAARVSVGQHHGPVYQIETRYLCEDIDTLRSRLADANDRIGRALADHDIGKLLITIDGVGPATVARVIAAVGNPAWFRSAAAFAAYVGPVPAIRQSGKRKPLRSGLSRLGNADLRGALWMPTLVAVKHNAWLRPYYQRLVARGKPKKVALVASMRKLLCAMYSVAANQRPFVPHIPKPLLPARP